MPELTSKGSPEKKDDAVAPAQPPKEEKATVPMELASAKNGIQIIIQGDFVEVRLSQYLAEHLGMFRSCKYVSAKFKVGQAPDIMAIHEQG